MDQKIYCLSCKKVVSRTGNNLCSYCGSPNWGYGRPVFIPGPGGRSPQKTAIIVSSVLVFIVFTASVIYYFNHRSTLGKIGENNVYILKNTYVYTVRLEFSDGESEEINMIKNAGNEFDVYNADSSAYNCSYAFATMLDESGILITSKYATEPWNNEADIQYLNEYFRTKTEGTSVTGFSIYGQSLSMTIRRLEDNADYSEPDPEKETECIRCTSDSALPVSCVTTNSGGYYSTVTRLRFSQASPADMTGKEFAFLTLPLSYDNSIPRAMLREKEITLNSSYDRQQISDYFVVPDEKLLMEGALLFNDDGEIVGLNTGVNGIPEKGEFSTILLTGLTISSFTHPGY